MKDLTFGEKQKQIILSPANRQLVSGSYRSGKSYLALYKIIQICRMEPGHKFLVGRYFHADLLGDTYEILFNPEDGLLNEALGRRDKFNKTFTFWNGSMIFFRHFDQSEGLKGMTLTGYYLEQAEQIKEYVWRDIASRLSGWGDKKNASSPISKYIIKYKNDPNVRKEPQYYELLGCNPDPNSFIKKRFIHKTVKGWEQYHLTMWDNEINLGKEYIQQQIDENNEIYVQRYVYGSWDMAEGLIYEEFTSDHIVSHRLISNIESSMGKSKFVVVMDPGYTHKFGVLFALVHTSNHITVIDELYESNKTAQEMAELIKQKCLEWKRTPELYIMDFAANKADGTSGKSYQDIFLENGIYTTNAKKNVMEGINEVKNRFKNRKLSISNKCRYLKDELGMYVWDKHKPDTPVKQNDDLVDPLRYLVMHTIKVKEDPKETKGPTGEELQKMFNKSLVAKLNRDSNDD